MKNKHAKEIIWKDIPEFIGRYKANNLGEIFSVRRNKIMKQSDNAGYKYVNLFKNGENKLTYIHRIIANLFNVKKSEDLEVNHINGNKADNNSCNLEWVSRSKNLKHWAKINGGMSDYFKKIGSTGGQATKKKYGKVHYQKLAENMNKKKAQKIIKYIKESK